MDAEVTLPAHLGTSIVDIYRYWLYAIARIEHHDKSLVWPSKDRPMSWWFTPLVRTWLWNVITNATQPYLSQWKSFQQSVFMWCHAVLQHGCYNSNGNQYSFMQASNNIIVCLSPCTSPFVVQAHDDCVRTWCAWLPWISRSVCAIRRPCWRKAGRRWKSSIL